MSMLLRSAPLRAARVARVPQLTRAAHFENKVDHATPFKVTSKIGLAAKMGVFVTLSFGLPFFASWFQIQKAAGA